MQIVKFYLLLINFISFGVFGFDKWLAKRNKWRISEERLLLACFFGGSFGALASMSIFRHKTQKIKFKLGVPLILALQIAIVILVSRQILQH